MVVLHSGYSSPPEFKGVNHIVNFEAPAKYNLYKENGSHID
jgi:hypothetical protein